MKLLLVFLLVATAARAQWSSINPGAGGQVQDVVCDPNTSNRLILASDMEGIYESTDNGESWHPKGDLHQNRVYAVAIPKAPSNQKLYVGTLYGLEVSSDGGNKFALVGVTKGKSIACIAVDPNNSNIVLAGLGWRDDYDFVGTFGMSPTGTGEIFRSVDGGNSWSTITFNTNNATDRNIFTMQFDKNNSNIVYMGSAKGIYKSTNAGLSWSLIAGPSGTYKNRGVSLTPDGAVLYAAYTTTTGQDYGGAVKAHVYATRTSSINWRQVTAGSGLNIGNFNFWYPEVDHRSTGTSHKVLIAFEENRKGLYEGTFNWNYTNNTLSYAWAQIWKSTDVTDGWDVGVPNARFAHYTPNSANWARAVWSTQNQTIYKAVWNGNSFIWTNQYSKPNPNFSVSYYGTPIPTYSGRGTESTYTWDIAVYSNYVIQGQGDNGAVESWDNGVSWSNIWMRVNGYLSDVQAVEIGNSWGAPMVLAQMTQGFGGNAANGQLYIKKLESRSTADVWESYAGGSSYKGGLPAGVYSDIAVAPSDPGRIFVFSRGHGLYMQEDLGWGYNEHKQGRQPWFVKISNGIADQIGSVKKIAVHPTNKNIVFLSSVSGATGVFKGFYNGASWIWTKVYDGSGWDAEVTSWVHNGQVYLFYSGRTSQAGGDGNNFVGALSLDQGATWRVVLTKSVAQSILSRSWFNDVSAEFRFENKGGIVGYDNKIIVSYYDHRLQKTYGVFQGTISGANVTWNDFTGDLPFGGLTSAKIVTSGADRYLYVATAGAGAWRRTISGSTVNQPPSVTLTSPVNHSTFNPGNQITMNASAADNDGSVSKVQFYNGATLLGQDTSAPFSVTISSAITGSYALSAKATDNLGAISTSPVVNVTVAAPGEPKPNQVTNGEFDDGTTGWNQYGSTGTVFNFSVVAGAGLSGNNSAKIAISPGGAGTGDSDIQVYSEIINLSRGVTYDLTFKAKSTASRTIRAGILGSTSPYTNYLSQTVTLSGSVQDYALSFTATEAVPARLHFFLGGNASDAWIDRIILRQR